MNYYSEPNLFSSPVFVVAIFLAAVILIIIIVLYIWRYFVRKGYRLPEEMQKIVLKVAVPKESQIQDIKAEVNAQKIQEQIAWAENLWASLGSIKPAKGFKAWFYGRYDEMALEIVAQDKLIYFYVIVPNYLRNFIEQQIQAQYPHAQVEEAEDYNIFSSQGSAAAAVLKLDKEDVYPIKTYRKMESDPLSALTNSLSKLGEDEGAVIQYVIRPVKETWHAKGRKIAQEVSKGKDLQEVLKNTRSKAWYDKVGGAVLKGAGSALSSGAKPEEEKDFLNQPQLSAMDQEALKSIEEKSSKAGVEVNLRVVVSSSAVTSAQANLDNILNSFAQYNIYEYGNAFEKLKIKKIDEIVIGFIHRSFYASQGFVLNIEELASVYHFPLPSTATPNIAWLGARKAAAPVNVPEQGLILGKNIYRGKETIVRIKADDRRRHVYIIGMTGTGKSKLMVNMALQDIQNGEGVCYIDPHGEEVELLAANIPPERMDDVIYFNPADKDKPTGLNMLEAENAEQKDFATQEMISIFYKLVTDPQMLGPMFEHYMRNAMLLLMSDKDDPGTIVEIPRVFTDEKFRQAKLKKCDDMLVRSFWEKEYAASQRGSTAADMLSYVISKVGRFIENEMMRNVIGQPKSGFDIREIMDKKKILLVNLSKGRVGEMNSDLLGLILVSKLQMAALGRANLPQEQRHDFYLYIDEFQNYVTDSITTILAEARKYRLNLTMAHQYIGQLVRNQDTSVRDAVFGNVGTLCVHRVGVEDAEFLAKQYAPVFNEFDLINIEKYQNYMRLLIDNQAARPFNSINLPPPEFNTEVAHAVVQTSREKYGRPKKEVEQEITRRSKLGEGLGKDSKTEVDMR